MKVGKLVEALQKLDPEIEVFRLNNDNEYGEELEPVEDLVARTESVFIKSYNPQIKIDVAYVTII